MTYPHMIKKHQLPLYVDDTAGQTILDIASKARKLKIEQGLSFIMIDYLQIIKNHSKQNNKADQVGGISGAIKALAKDLEIPNSQGLGQVILRTQVLLSKMQM